MAVRCPQCEQAPRGAAWRCDACHAAYDAVAALGACPECAIAWVDVACPGCGEWSPLEAWHTEPGARAQVAARLDEAELALGDAARPRDEKAPSLARLRGEVARLVVDASRAEPGSSSRAGRGLVQARAEAVRLAHALQRLARRTQQAPGGAPWRPILAQPEAWGTGLGALARRAGLEHRQALAALEALGGTADVLWRRVAHTVDDLIQEGAGVDRGSRVLRRDVRAQLDACDRALAQDPGRAEAWQNRAAARSDLGDLRGALADAEQVAALGRSAPGDAERLRADVRRLLGDLAGADRDARRAVEAAPTVASNHYVLAQVRYARGDLTGCLAALDRLAPLEPDATRGWRLRFHAERSLLRRRAAVDEALGIRPNTPDLLTLRALCELHDDRLEHARLDVERALRLRPHDVASRVVEAQVAAFGGAPEEARAALDRAVRLCPEWYWGWCLRGTLHLGEGSFALARSDLDVAVRRAADDAYAHVLRSHLRGLTSDLRGARADLEAASALRGDDAVDARLWLAARFDEPGRLEGARPTWAWDREVVAHARSGSQDLEPLLAAAERAEPVRPSWVGGRRAQVFALAAARADARGDAAMAVAHAERALASLGPVVNALSETGAWVRARLLVARGHPVALVRGLAPTVPPEVLERDAAPVATPIQLRVVPRAATPVAPEPVAPAPAPVPAAAVPSIVDLLERLVALHRAGVLDDAELAAAKRKVLGLE